MVDSIGMQQVLQLSNTIERVQMAQQSQASEQARGFDKEFEKAVDRSHDQTHETSETENAKIRDEEEEAPPPTETGQGKIINVVA